MSEWKEYRLEEIAQLEKNSWKVGDEELPYIALEHIVEGGLRLQGIGDSNTIASNKYRFNSDCFLFGKLRPYFRKLYRPNFEGICSTDIWVVKPKGENNKDFLFYFFANQEFVDFTYSGSSGTRMPRADWNFVGESKWNFPEPTEQKAIAEVLSSLDDKIDLLHRQNKTLEQMAETLFRQWFLPAGRQGVEEAKEDWEVGVVSDLAEHLKKSIKPQQNEDTLFNHYSIPSYDNGKEPVKEMGREIKSNKYDVPTNCILFSKLNPHKDKRVWLLQDNLPDNPICSTEFQIVYPKNGNSLYFLYGWLSINENYREIASGVGGTSGSHQRISPSEIFDFRCPIIPDEQVYEYSLVIEPIYRKQFNNQTQIRTLEKLRNTLLPKLMSGEVRVKMELHKKEIL